MFEASLNHSLTQALTAIDQVSQVPASLQVREVGRVRSVANGIAHVTGLPNVGYEELVRFANGLFGIAFDLNPDDVGVVLLGDYWRLQAGDEVERTGRVMDVPVGDALIGRVMNPLGIPLDDAGDIVCQSRLPIERPAAAIMDRQAVNTPVANEN